VVIDQGGGLHALGKRILDMTATKIRDRMSDISREELPTVEHARALLLEHATEKRQKQEKPAPVWDRDRDDRAWQDAVINAAIDKEKIERNCVEPGQRRAGAAGSEKEWPVMPPMPEPIRTSPRYHFEDAARATTRTTSESTSERAQERAERGSKAHLEKETNAKTDPRTVSNGSFKRTVKAGKGATRAIGNTLDAVGSAVESLFAPTLTPAQIREGERSAHRREAETERTLDFAKYTTELALQRQQQENEREAERRRHRDGGGRER
jgi:hypothetical protein